MLNELKITEHQIQHKKSEVNRLHAVYTYGVIVKYLERILEDLVSSFFLDSFQGRYIVYSFFWEQATLPVKLIFTKTRILATANKL